MGYSIGGTGKPILNTNTRKGQTIMRADLFTKDSPFKTVEEYTEWWLEKKGHLDLLKEAEELNTQYRMLHMEEVPLYYGNKKSYNPIEEWLESI